MKKLRLISIIGFSIISVLTILFLIPHKNNKQTGGDLEIKNNFEWLQMKYRNPKTGKIPSNIRSLELQFASKLPGAISNGKHIDNNMLNTIWKRRGPINIGGRTRAVGIDIRNENIINAGGVSSGMWHSTDNGNTWNRTTSLNQLSSVSCITQDKRQGKENVWYYGTGEFFGNSAAILGNGIFKSTDNGLSWFQLPSTVIGSPVSWDNQFDYIWNIVTDKSNSNQDVVYAAYSLGGISRSTDGGNSWQNVLGGFGNNRSFCTDVSITSSGVLYAALSEYSANNASSVTKGIYRSTDGLVWTNITPSFIPKNYNRVVIGIAPSDENIVYFVGETPNSGLMTISNSGDTSWHSFWKYTYKSGDGSGIGGDWEDRSLNLPIMDNYRRGSMNSQRGYDLVLTVKPDNPDIVFLGGTNIYRSTDAFKTNQNYKWVGGYYYNEQLIRDYAEYPNHHPDIHSLVFSYNNPNILYTGTDGGIHKTLDCMADSLVYTSLNNAYYTTQFYTIALGKQAGSPLISGGLQDNTTLLTIEDNLNYNWKTVTKGDGFFCEFAESGDIIYTSRNSSYQPKVTLWRTKLDKDGNKLTQTRIDPHGGADFIWNTPFKLDPNNQNRLYLAGGRVIWRNNDLSSIPFVDSRDSISTGWDSLTYTYNEDELITALEVSRSPQNIIFYGTSGGRVFKLDNAGSGSPIPVEITGINFPDAFVSCITADPDDASKLFVAFSNYGVQSIFYSENSGQSWVQVSGNLEEYKNGTGNGPAVNWISILKVNGKILYLAGTSTGLYSTSYLDDEYTVWTQESADLIGNNVIHMLDIRQSDRTVAVGSHGAGVFTAQIDNVYNPPEAPLLLYPANDTGGVKSSVPFVWKPVKDAVYYTFELSATEDFSIPVQTIKGITGTKLNIQIPDDLYIKYYWRVFAVNSGGYSIASEKWTFQSAAAPPLLIYPAHTATDVPVDPELQWSFMPCCSGHHVQVSTSLSFGSGMITDTIISISPLKLHNLEYNKRYYWRVSSIDGWGEGAFSKSNNFRTINSTDIYSKRLSDLVSVYPIPAKDILTVKFDNDIIKYTEVWIASLNSALRRKLYSDYSLGNGNKITLDISDFLPGFYLIIITNENEQMIKPIVIY